MMLESVNIEESKIGQEVQEVTEECGPCGAPHKKTCLSAPHSENCCDEVNFWNKRSRHPKGVKFCRQCEWKHKILCSRKKRKLSKTLMCSICGDLSDITSLSIKEFPGNKWACFVCLKKLKDEIHQNDEQRMWEHLGDFPCGCLSDFSRCDGYYEPTPIENLMLRRKKGNGASQEYVCPVEDQIMHQDKLTKFFDCCDESQNGILLCKSCVKVHERKCNGGGPRSKKETCLTCTESVVGHQWYAEKVWDGKKWMCFDCVKLIKEINKEINK